MANINSANPTNDGIAEYLPANTPIIIRSVPIMPRILLFSNEVIALSCPLIITLGQIDLGN